MLSPYIIFREYGQNINKKYKTLFWIDIGDVFLKYDNKIKIFVFSKEKSLLIIHNTLNGFFFD